MSRGETLPPETSTYTDRRTGAEIRQVTADRAIAHHPYFFLPAYDRAMEYLFVVSHRTGEPEVFAVDRSTWELRQLTEADAIDEYSVCPGPDGAFVYATAEGRALRVDVEAAETEVLVDFHSAFDGAVSTSGTTSVDPSGETWAVPVSVDGIDHLVLVDTATGDHASILTHEAVAHPQFCPDDPDWLFHAGPLTDRAWVARRDGTEHRRLYEQGDDQWITHETWIPGRREVALVDWPNGIRAVHVETGVERWVTNVNAWHAVANPTGHLMVADTAFPDIGIQLFDPRDGVAKHRTLCYPAASSIGEHWDGPFPYADGPIETYSPQHTHPHPSFSPDGERIVYTSDRSGFAQVYEVAVPDR